MAKRQKENKEEKKVQPILYTMHAKCVITIPNDVQLTCNNHGKDLVTHPKPKMKLLGLIVDNDTPADETTIITSEDDTIIIDENKS